MALPQTRQRLVFVDDHNLVWTEPQETGVRLLDLISDNSPLLTLASDLNLPSDEPLPLSGVTLANFVRAYEFLTLSSEDFKVTDEAYQPEVVRVLDSIIMPREVLIWNRYHNFCESLRIKASLAVLKNLLDLEVRGEAKRGFFCQSLVEYKTLLAYGHERLVPFQMLTVESAKHSKVIELGLHAISLDPLNFDSKETQLVSSEETKLEAIRARQIGNRVRLSCDEILDCAECKSLGASGLCGACGNPGPPSRCGFEHCIGDLKVADRDRKIIHEIFGPCGCYLREATYVYGKPAATGLNAVDGVEFRRNQAWTVGRFSPSSLDGPIFHELTPAELNPKACETFKNYLADLRRNSITVKDLPVVETIPMPGLDLEGKVNLHLGFVLLV